MERLEPFGGHIEDLRATIGATAVINNIRGMFGGQPVTLLDPRDIIPWYEREPEKLLFNPSDPDYNPDAHANAIRELLMGKSTKADE